MSQLGDIPHFFRHAIHLALGKRLRPWIIIPLIFNTFLFGFLYWLAAHFVNLWISGLMAGWHFVGFWSFLDPLAPYLQGLLMLLAWVLLLVLFANLFTLAVQLVAAPFLGMLAEQVNRDTTPLPLPEESLLAMLRRTLVREARKLWYWLWRAPFVLLLVLIFYLVPGLNLLASALWFVFSAWILAMQYIDYGADCRQVPLAETRRRLHGQRWLVLGFGCIMLALTLIPLVNLVIMPIGVIVGTLIWNERLTANHPLSTTDESLQ